MTCGADLCVLMLQICGHVCMDSLYFLMCVLEKATFCCLLMLDYDPFFGSLLHRGCEYLPLWLPLSPLSMSHHCRLKRGQKCLVSQVF